MLAQNVSLTMREKFRQSKLRHALPILLRTLPKCPSSEQQGHTEARHRVEGTKNT